MNNGRTCFTATSGGHPILGSNAIALALDRHRVSLDRARASVRCSSRERGYTLLEVMIVLAIVAILASVALPAYNNTLVRSNRAAAQSYLLDLANREEQYLLDARTYTTTVSDLLAAPAAVTPYYTVTITVPLGSTIANAYKITAAPVATSIQKNDGNLTIDQDGVKTGTW